MKNPIAKINRSNRITKVRKTGLILIGTIIVITNFTFADRLCNGEGLI